MQKVFLAVFTLLCGAFPVSSFAQNVPDPQSEIHESVPAEVQSPAPSPLLSQSTHQNFFADFAKDQTNIWMSPLKIKRGDVKWLAPLGAGAALLLMEDHKISNHFETHPNLKPVSSTMGEFGGGLQMLGASGGMWAIGKLTGSPKLARTGMLAGEAVAQTELLTKAIKWTANRTRPNGNAHSFPSGHSASAFALASVVAHQYHDKPLVVVGAYGLATAMGMSRVKRRLHFPSDVMIGAVIGELVGRYIVHRHPADER